MIKLLVDLRIECFAVILTLYIWIKTCKIRNSSENLKFFFASSFATKSRNKTDHNRAYRKGI